MRETWVGSLGWEDSLEVGMATQSSILVWRIPWTEEPEELQSMGLQRVRHDWNDWARRHTCISIEIINNKSVMGTEESSRWANLRTIAQITLIDFSGEACFSAQFYILLEQRTLHQSGCQDLTNKQTLDLYVHSMALAPRLGILSKDQHQHPRKEGIESLFLTCTYFTSGQCGFP